MLTDKEIDAVITAQWGEQQPVMYTAHRAFARAIISATVAKLAAGVSVEPVSGKCNDCQAQGVLHCNDPMNCGGVEWRYSHEQLQTAIAAARVQAIGDVADILAEYDCLNSGMGREIRALIGGSHD